MARVLVVGDIMLDEFVYGDVNRISPEAATPVLLAANTLRMIGGAANVAHGVQALDCDCSLVGVVGEDRAGHDLTNALTVIDDAYVVVDKDRQTTHKTRFVSAEHSTHMLRVDRESVAPISLSIQDRVLDRAMRSLDDADVLVLSDYCKGVVEHRLANTLIAAARGQNKTVIVDTKRTDLTRFKGATILKLNHAELEKVRGRGRIADDDALLSAGTVLALTNNIHHIVVTQGERGLMLVSPREGGHTRIEGRVVRVRDVSGAGDTVVATLAARLAAGEELVAALHVANNAAAIAVGKIGTASVTTAELNGGKVAPAHDWALLEQRLKEWRGLKLGFTNGCFDLLHPGHLHLLMQARARCDKLIVGINNDASVTRYKGLGRPAQDEQTRAEMLAALDCVDLVVVFDHSTPLALVKVVRPDLLFKGGDYKLHEVIGQEFAGGVHIVPRLAEHSTTKTIARIK